MRSEPISPTMYAKSNAPIIIEKVTKIRSLSVDGIMSPYPTVVNVVNAQ